VEAAAGIDCQLVGHHFAIAMGIVSERPADYGAAIDSPNSG